MYLYLIGTIKYSDKFIKMKYNTWKSSAFGHINSSISRKQG